MYGYDVIRDLLIKGGPIIWPLMACSLVSLTITMERMLFWWRAERRNRQGASALEDLFEHTDQGQFEQALDIGRSQNTTILRVLTAGLKHRRYGLAENMEIAANDEIAHMKHGLSVMDTIITMAPLLGILGTVLGIIRSFNVLGMNDIQSSAAVTRGVAESLISTAVGITVALLTLVPFNAFISKVQRESRRIEQTIAQFETAYRKGTDHAPGNRLRV